MSTLIIGNRFKKGILFLLSIILLLVVIGVILPSSYHVERSVIISRPSKMIFPYLNNIQKWTVWTSLNQNKDFSLEQNFFGPPQGIGSGMSYQGDKLGKGKIEIIDNELNDHVSYSLLINNRFNTQGNIQLTSISDSSTQVSISLDGDVGFHLPNRYIILLMDNIAGSLFQESLIHLKSIVETKKTAPVSGL
ncbi:SRPBCC family protein [Cytophaga hutchinsonii]|uniref:Polyketide cyclase n=1 Tax=Cytophaga hutchinsonii (strain ATCC 33406 / DSM 1761 / CIP 103989 / NBRC 15051 / NCIMB 9469 / D465) TaxID=269798 RepID=A0A6N4SWF9_CYTH3|nr:SRPBCC family protein [Cytophaga hutchinsonii]ABG60940.1 conserved hypothetical protein [Cytophaga hutchinsonii ATCC 33406]SFX42853.1 hypothetical protein SAMN04487930_10454 [Cytophaga hutchinsonii ATCC 33406]